MKEKHMSLSLSNTNFVIDTDELLCRMMGSVEMAQRMLLRFAASATDEADLLETHIRSGDAKCTKSLAHRHAGTAKTLAIHQVAKLALQIEQHASEQPFDCSKLLTIVQQLRQSHREVTEFAKTTPIQNLAARKQVESH